MQQLIQVIQQTGNNPVPPTPPTLVSVNPLSFLGSGTEGGGGGGGGGGGRCAIVFCSTDVSHTCLCDPTQFGWWVWWESGRCAIVFVPRTTHTLVSDACVPPHSLGGVCVCGGGVFAVCVCGRGGWWGWVECGRCAIVFYCV